MRGRKKKFQRLRKMLVKTSAAFLAAGSVSCWLMNDLEALVPDEKIVSEEDLKETGIQIKLQASSRQLERSRVFAHRGFASDVPDNSFASFDAAAASGCPQIELDVRASQDGILFVSHDDQLKDASGNTISIAESSAALLDACMLANGEKLHRLSEIFDRYDTNMIYLVEFKDEDLDGGLFYQLMHEYPEIIGNLQAQSFSPKTLLAIHETFPNMYVQALVNQESDIDWLSELDFIDGMAVKYSLLNQEIINSIHALDLECWAWTVDKPEDIQRLDTMGIDGVITNFSSALEFIEEKTI